MIKNNSKKRRYNRMVYGNKSGKTNCKNDIKQSSENNKKKRNYKKNVENKPNMNKYKDIRNEYSTIFDVKFNIFGKIVYDKKEILKTFGLYAPDEIILKKQEKYYNDKLRDTLNNIMKILFKNINKIKKKDLKYIHNTKFILIPLYFLTVDKNFSIKVIFDKIIINGKSYFTMKLCLGDMFSIFKLAQYTSFDFIKNEKTHDEIFYHFYDSNLRGFIYEPRNLSYGYFLNYKEANRNFANYCTKVIESKECWSDKIENLVKFTKDELMKYVIVKSFNKN